MGRLMSVSASLMLCMNYIVCGHDCRDQPRNEVVVNILLLLDICTVISTVCSHNPSPEYTR